METEMKTTILALALVATIAPTLAIAGSPIDVTRRIGPFDPANPIADSLNGAAYDMPQLHSDAIDDAVLGKTNGSSIDVVAKVGASLKCTVTGTPSEFPNDLLVANTGLVMIPAGTRLSWKAAAEKGTVELDKALVPGKSLRLRNVLDSGIEAGSACTARAIGL
jgi:hypothetical protein